MSINDILLTECVNKSTVQDLKKILSTYPDNAYVTFVCRNARCNPLCFKQVNIFEDQNRLLVTIELEEVQDFRPHLPI